MLTALSARAWNPLAVVYAPGAVTLAVDLWLPLDVDTAIFYSVGIVMSGFLRSRWNLWLATALFILFAFSDLVIGSPQAYPMTPDWVFLANRSFLACALLLLAGIVHLRMRSAEAVEQSQALLARQNEQLRNIGTELERQVQERTRELQIASQERERAQAALYQAQKMEAVGRLTGGVAHDFNNLLTVVGGNAAILREHVETAREGRLLDAILHAADRGARLTRLLLAFSGRQTLHPETLDLMRIRDTATSRVAIAEVISSWTAKISLSGRSYRCAQICEALATSISWAVTRTRSADFWTLPSST